MLFPVPPVTPSNLTSTSLVLPSAMPLKGEKEVATKAQFKKWGEETLQRLFTEFRSDRPGLYSDERSSEKPKKSGPAFMWGCGVMLSALTAAAKDKPKEYKPRLEPFITGLEVYWNNAGDVGGYDVLPLPKPPDRYYDDNAWVAISLMEASSVTGNKDYLQKAKRTLDYVLSGEDKKEGGVYWRENPRDSKNTCSNAPAIVAALQFFQMTGDATYKDTAIRIYGWTNKYLQDKDGLYFDNIKLDGNVEKRKWAYNSALMIRANLLMAEVEKNGVKKKLFLVEARRIADASEAKWIVPETGAFDDEAFFAVHLSEALLLLARQDKDTARRDLTLRALTYLGQTGRGADGYFPTHWSNKNGKRNRTSLLDQASAARAFLFAASSL